MISYLNRALEVYWNWEKEESRLKALDGLKPDAMDLLKVKYDFLRHGVYRVGIDPSVMEGLTLQVMEAALYKMEQQLYPNRFVRAAHRLKVALIDRPNYVDKFLKFKAENLNNIDMLLKSKGLDHYFGKLEQYLDFERNAVHIEYPATLNEAVNFVFRVKLEKGEAGNYEQEGLYARSRHPGNPEKDRDFDFDVDYNISAQQAANLLMGRPVLNGSGVMNQFSENQWVQLEDAANPHNYGIKVFQADQGYDLANTLDSFAAETGVYRATAPDVILNLQLGYQVKLSGRHPLDQPVFIEASPATGGILIRDHQQKVIGKDEIFPAIKKELDKDRGKDIQISKEEKDQSNQQDQSPGIGL